MSLPRMLLIAVLAGTGAPMLRAAPPAGYWLAWSDECSSNDTSKFANWQSGWRRDAYNTGSAISHSNGIRTISTYTAGGTNYTGMISTSGRFEQRYGFWEAYIDYNGMTGMWSAFWIQSPTMGSYIGDPARGGSEIDVCEHRSFNGSGSFIGSDYVINNHWDGYGADHKSVGTTVGGVGANTGFHTYGLLWNETEYQFYYDNVWRWTTTNGHSQRPQFAILSSEVEDASWAGNIPPAGYGTTNNPLAKMQIDWVRWYAPSNYTIWDGNSTNGSWANTNNWVGGRTPDAGRVVVFDDFTRAGYTNHLNANRTIGGLVVTEPGNAIVIASNTLTLGAAGIDMEMNNHSLTLNCGVTLGAGQTWHVGSLGLTVNGIVAGAHSITKLGDGSLTLAGSNAYTLATTIRAGTLYVANNWALGSAASGTTIAAGARLYGTTDVTCPEDLAIAGSGPDGSGAMRIGSGASVVWNGSLRLTNDALVKLDGGTALALNDTVSISNFTLTIAGDGSSIGTINAVVTGAGWVVKSGSGTWTIATNQPTAATHWFADGGTLNFTSCSVTATTWCGAGSASNAAGTLALNAGARFACSGDFNVADVDGSRGTLNIASGATLLPSSLYVGKWGNATGTVNQSGGTVTNYDATPGDWRIGGYSNTNDADALGRYNLDAGSFHTAGNLHVGAYGRGEWLQDGGTGTVAGWVSAGRFGGGVGVFSVSNGLFVQTDAAKRFIVGEQGTGTLVIAGAGQVVSSGGVHIAFGPASRGTVQLNGGTLATTFLQSTGGVSALQCNGGVLRALASSANFIQTIDSATVQSAAIIDTANWTVTVAQAFSGTGRLVKTGSGILTLTASNAFSGGVIVSGGVLRSSAPHALGTGLVTVAAGGSLGGTGRIYGAVSVGGELSPGYSVGTLPTGAQTWQPGGKLLWELSSATNPAGRDFVAMAGALTIAATTGSPFTVRLSSPAGPLADFNNRNVYAWPLVVASGGISGFAADRFTVDAAGFSNVLAGGTFSVAATATNLLLVYTPPPPPQPQSLQLSNSVPAITGIGVGGVRYWLDAASNLAAPVTWSALTNTLAGTNGVFLLLDGATNAAQRFYRIREVQP